MNSQASSIGFDHMFDSPQTSHLGGGHPNVDLTGSVDQTPQQFNPHNVLQPNAPQHDASPQRSLLGGGGVGGSLLGGSLLGGSLLGGSLLGGRSPRSSRSPMASPSKTTVLPS